LGRVEANPGSVAGHGLAVVADAAWRRWCSARSA
jgi:hypothetical protein